MIYLLNVQIEIFYTPYNFKTSFTLFEIFLAL